MRACILILMLLSGVFTPLSAQTQNGLASVRPLIHEGIMTKNGERFSHDSLVASHRDIPFGTLTLITNLRNGMSIQVKINDRGPFVKGHILDLSEVAAKQIGLSHGQLTEIKLQILKTKRTTSAKPKPSNISSHSLGKTFIIQIASYSEMENAINYKNQLLKTYNLNKKIKITPENLDGEILYKINIESFKTREEAEEYKTRLPKALQNGYVTSQK